MLQEIDPETPCGPNLEHDPAFLALETEALGKPETQIGKNITAAVPPDWKQVRRAATALLERSRDLRLAVYLLRADLALRGMAGLAEGLELIEGLLGQRWDSVHPQLDPEDDLDPTQRINSLAVLADPVSLLRELKDATLVVLPGLGRLTIRTIDIANGETAPPPGQEKIALGSIEAAIADLDKNELDRGIDVLGRSLQAAVNIELMLVRRVGSTRALNLDPLTRPLRKAHDFLSRRQQASAAGAPAGTSADAGAPGAGSVDVPVARRSGGNDAIASRDDVVRLLDNVIQYYGRHEPSSPIPILLERAKRLVPMNFFELMENLAPDGIAQLTFIRGPDGSQESEQ
jgi:type VI secretion system protein ImpA